MSDEFGQAVNAWTTFYQFTGGVAGTLLGLLFAAITLRREVFQHPALAYVRDFIAMTLETLVAALLVAALLFAPHGGSLPMVIGLTVIAMGGLAGLMHSVRQWSRSAVTRPSAYPEGWTPRERRGQALILVTACPFIIMLVAAGLIGRWGPAGLGGLALAQVGLLLVAMASTWSMVAQAGNTIATPPAILTPAADRGNPIPVSSDPDPASR